MSEIGIPAVDKINYVSIFVGKFSIIEDPELIELLLKLPKLKGINLYGYNESQDICAIIARGLCEFGIEIEGKS